MSEAVEKLEGLNEAQLRDLIQRAQEKLQERQEKRLEELKQLAREAGYEVTLRKIGEEPSRATRRASRRAGKQGQGDDRRREVAAKYRNPDNPSETWSGARQKTEVGSGGARPSSKA